MLNSAVFSSYVRHRGSPQIINPVRHKTTLSACSAHLFFKVQLYYSSRMDN